MTFPISPIWSCRDPNTDLHSSMEHKSVPLKGELEQPPVSHHTKATLTGAQSQTNTHAVVCVCRKALRLSPQNRPTDHLHCFCLSTHTSQACPITATPTTSSHKSWMYVTPTDPSLCSLPSCTSSDSALTQGLQLCAPCLSKAKAVSEKCTHRRAEKPPLCNGITSSKLLTHQGENLAVGKTTL